MKKLYSSLGLLNRELSSYTEPFGFFRHFVPKRKNLNIVLPYYDYLRGLCFLEDLRDNFGQEFPLFFGIGELLHLLYDDFLTQIKQGAKNEQISHYLINSYNKYFHSTKKQKTIMKPVTKTLLQFHTIEEEIPNENQEKMAYLTVKMKESEIMRGEVLLFDLSPKMNNLDISVEQVITIVYLDFIETIKLEGNSIKVQKSIITHLKRF
ncbi:MULTISPECIES: hypothetical protein [Bacillati]|uniref:hypothetical protein n=1 Tax=Bacillati TaxID=1783272 RepID=UPI0022B987D1|nr:hypothetical protein [Caldifermentibacillus hisashii]